MGGGKGGGGKQRVTEYRSSVWLGMALGPVELLKIFANKREIFSGLLTGQIGFRINRPNRFGGIRKEGGVGGHCYFYPGNDTQLLDTEVASKLGGTPTTLPSARGIASVYLTDSPGAGQPGFYHRANVPYMPDYAFEVRDIDSTWEPGLAIINRPSTGDIDFTTGTFTPSPAAPSGQRLTKLDSAAGQASYTLYDSDIELSPAETILYTRVGNEDVYEYENTTVFADGVLGFVDLYALAGGPTYANLQITISCEFQQLQDQAGGIPTRESLVVIANADGTGNDYASRGAQTFISGLNGQTTGSAYPWTPISFGPVSVPSGSRWLAFGFNGGPARAQMRRPRVTITGTVPQGAADMNPAHIIRALLTDRKFGRGVNPSFIDDVSFLAAANTLFTENFGLSFPWINQASVQDVINEVLDHIEGTLYFNVRTGKYVLKLLRDDYVVASLPVLDRSNSKLLDYRERLPDERVNQIDLTWTDPDNEEETAITIQEPHAMVEANEIISDSRNYYGVRTIDLAWQLAQRDIATASAPLATAELQANQDAFDLYPGDVVRIIDPDYPNQSIDIVARIAKIKKGDPSSPAIEITATEDIFSFARPNYQQPVLPNVVSPGQDPSIPEFINFMSLNYFLSVLYFGVANASAGSYPDAVASFLISTNNTDAQEYELYGDVTDPSGNVTLSPLATLSAVGRGALQSDLPFESTSSVSSFGTIASGSLPEVGGFVVFGAETVSEDRVEIALIRSFDGVNYTLARGVLDTIPRVWAAGTTCQFISANTFISDGQIRAAFATPRFRVGMRTSLGLFDINAAPDFTRTLNERLHQPTRPANVAFNGDIGTTDVNASLLDPIPITWAQRNRLTEDSQPLDWDAATVVPEAGQTTTIRLRRQSDNSIINEITGLTGENYDLTHADFLGEADAIVEVLAANVVNGTPLESFQFLSRVVKVASGYGQNYGQDYG